MGNMGCRAGKNESKSRRGYICLVGQNHINFSLAPPGRICDNDSAKEGLMDKLNFLIQNIQSALFLESFAFRNKLAIASKINNAVGQLFDGDPMMLDLFPEAPPEIPRIQLKDSRSIYSLNFSVNRIDFFYNEPEKPTKTFDSIKDEYLTNFFKINRLVKEDYHLETPRIALVIKAISEIDMGSNLFLQQEFLGSKGFFKNTYALEIHALEKTVIGQFAINRWFRIKTARDRLGKDGTLFVEIDINTQPEKEKGLGKQEIEEFYSNGIEFAKRSFLRCFGSSL